VEYRVVWPDGSAHWIEARGQMFSDDAGKPAYMAGVSVDITRQKQALSDSTFLAHASNELSALIDPRSTLDRLAYLAVPFFADWCTIDMLEDGDTLRRSPCRPAEGQAGERSSSPLSARSQSGSRDMGSRSHRAASAGS
jgi:hypothetical protein